MFCKRRIILIKKTPTQGFSWEFRKIFKNTFFIKPPDDCSWKQKGGLNHWQHPEYGSQKNGSQRSWHMISALKFYRRDAEVHFSKLQNNMLGWQWDYKNFLEDLILLYVKIRTFWLVKGNTRYSWNPTKPHYKDTKIAILMTAHKK